MRTLWALLVPYAATNHIKHEPATHVSSEWHAPFPAVSYLCPGALCFIVATAFF